METIKTLPFERIHVTPGDVVVVTAPGRISTELEATIADKFKKAIGDYPVLVLGDGMRVQVLRKGDD